MTKFLESSNAVQDNVAIDQDDHMLMIEFLESDQNDVSVTKFLD